MVHTSCSIYSQTLVARDAFETCDDLRRVHCGGEWTALSFASPGSSPNANPASIPSSSATSPSSPSSSSSGTTGNNNTSASSPQTGGPDALKNSGATPAASSSSRLHVAPAGLSSSTLAWALVVFTFFDQHSSRDVAEIFIDFSAGCIAENLFGKWEMLRLNVCALLQGCRHARLL